MAQITQTVAQGILDGQGYTDNEVRQLAHFWLSARAPADSVTAPAVGTIAHVGTGKTTLARAIASALRAASTPADSVTAPAGGAVSAPVFAFRRKGLDDFCTCTEERYAELSAKPNLFETRIFYTTPPTQAADSMLEDTARLEALHAAVTAIYLDDSSDFKSALGAVVRHLDPKLAGDLLAWPKRAFDISQVRLDAARKQGGA